VKLVVGLGNPGPRYAATRHNIGFRVVEHLAARHGRGPAQDRFGGRFTRGHLPGGLELALLEPLTWMNRSGDAVAPALDALPAVDPGRDLLVVFDDVDLPFGRLRLRPGGSGGGHRGLEHVILRLGRDDFPRLRFGVGRPGGPMETADWVLTPFSDEEERALEQLIPRAADAAETALVEGIAAAMSRYNAPAPAAE
jgi:PTH1 family peptidyl-tRNA hydrolase